MAKNIHFIGIGGIGTSSLAQILHERGDNISGSDLAQSQITKSLKLKGVKVYTGHSPKNIKKNIDLVIYSPAIPVRNLELKQAKKLGLKSLSYPKALGDFAKNFYTIAVAGTHGKSTTTAMLSVIAKNARLDPTVVVGTKIKEFKNKNFLTGKSNLLIIEACEYKKSFLNFSPDLLIITNLEADHLDYYKNFKDYKDAFKKLVKKSKQIIINSDDKDLKEVSKGAKILSWNSKNKSNFKLQLPGGFNQENANNAAVAAKVLGIDDETIHKSLKSFKGTWRRMDYKRKKLGKVKFIDDYAHHPTEIKLTLNAIRENNPDSKILCVFQPHQYSRTALLLKDFANSFIEVDEVIIPNIYKVRDTDEDLKKVSVDKLVDEIKKHKKKARNGKSLKNTAEYIKEHHKKYDIIVTMGAGDISTIYKKF